jgi:hypothetical protein
MARRYPADLRERAERLMFRHRKDFPSEWFNYPKFVGDLSPRGTPHLLPLELRWIINAREHLGHSCSRNSELTG